MVSIFCYGTCPPTECRDVVGSSTNWFVGWSLPVFMGTNRVAVHFGLATPLPACSLDKARHWPCMPFVAQQTRLDHDGILIEHGTCMHLSKFSKICWRVGFQFVRFGQITWLLVPIVPMPYRATSPCYGRSKAHALVLQNWTGKIFLQDLIRSSDIGCARYCPKSKNETVRYREKIYEHCLPSTNDQSYSKLLLYRLIFTSIRKRLILFAWQQDLGSAHGTFLGGVRLKPHEQLGSRLVMQHVLPSENPSIPIRP